MDDRPSEPRHELAIRFVGSGSEYFRIWIVNLLLTLVTLGLYYPFAKVRRLRYFHGATEVGGAALAFHADPWKMLRGYLLVVLMLAAYSLAGQFSAVAGAIAFLIVAALWPALWHSSMRFRLANTGWRGLRLRYTGARGGAYAAMAVPLGVSMLFVLAGLLVQAYPPSGGSLPRDDGESLGDWVGYLVAVPGVVLLLPMFVWLLKRLQHSNYALGSERTHFAAGLGSFYGLAAKTLGLGLVVIAGLVAWVFAVIRVGIAVSSAPNDWRWEWPQMIAAVAVAAAFPLVLLGAGAFWTARLQNLVWNRTSSAHLEFASALRARSLAGLWLKNWVLMLLTLGLYWPFAQVAIARLRLQAVAVRSTLDPDQLTAGAAVDEAAAGDAAGDLLGFDIGL